MYFLGLNAFMHDSSACLLRGNSVVAYAEEERFTREKHTGAFPVQALRYCLNKAQISINDIQHVGFAWRPFKHLFYRSVDLLKYFPRPFTQVHPQRRRIFFEMAGLPRFMRQNLGFRNQFRFLDHQSCHAASSYYTSPFSEASLLVLEANSERDTTYFGQAIDGEIQRLFSYRYPHSIGLFYLCVTEYLGFRENRDEGKVMGLAPYGEPEFVDDFRKLISFDRNKHLKLDMSYFDVHLGKKTYVTDKFIKKFGPRRVPEGEINKHHQNIAASLQKVAEETCIQIATDLYSRTGIDALCLSGGVALNSVMNGRLHQHSPFTRIHVPPVSNDTGTSLGAALLLMAKYGDTKSLFIRDFSPFLGPEFSDTEIEEELRSFGLEFCRPQSIASDTAEEIAAGKVVGWFQGALEVGPRALGNRSILGDPRRHDMKDILNLKVKHRESFRPFAPSVLVERAGEYFENEGIEVPFMLKVFPVKTARRSEIPAVTHVDGSARLQTVDKTLNPLYWELIDQFFQRTGCPIVVNTSFNVRGEPIVCTPREAIQCFLKTGLDVLAIGGFLVKNKERQ